MESPFAFTKNHLLFIYAFSIVRMNLPSSNCLVRSTERFDDERINTNR